MTLITVTVLASGPAPLIALARFPLASTSIASRAPLGAGAGTILTPSLWLLLVRLVSVDNLDFWFLMGISKPVQEVRLSLGHRGCHQLEPLFYLRVNVAR